MKGKTIWTVVGFLLFFFGLLSLILSVAGLQFSYMTWLDNFGRLSGFVIRLAMIFVGFILVAYVQTDWNREQSEIDEAKRRSVV